MRRLQRTIERQPRIWRFRGRRVVNAEEWKYADWTALPDEYLPFTVNREKAPPDWYADYQALMAKLEDPLYGQLLCISCPIKQAQDVRREIDRDHQHWQEQGGDNAKEEWYKELGELKAKPFRKADATRRVHWRIFNDLAGAKDRTCETINYFHCPYKDEGNQMLKVGYEAWRLWRHVEWYDDHWNRSTTSTPAASDMKWYHWNEPPIIDVTNYDDITRAIEDGRLDKIIQEHERYMKETHSEISAL
jgi:hypothetical protein